MHKTICFTWEMRHETMCFMEIMSFELARRRRTTTLLFHRRNATRFLLFYERKCLSNTYFLSKIEGNDDHFNRKQMGSLRKPKVRRHFPSTNEGNVRPNNVRWFFDLAAMASASWQVYHIAACDARKTHDLSSDFHFSGQGGACIQHTTWSPRCGRPDFWKRQARQTTFLGPPPRYACHSHVARRSSQSIVFLNGFAPPIKCRYIHTHLGRQYCVPHVSSWRFGDRQNSNASAKTTFLIAFFGHQVLTGTVRHVFYVQIGNETIPCKTQVIRGDTIKIPWTVSESL